MIQVDTFVARQNVAAMAVSARRAADEFTIAMEDFAASIPFIAARMGEALQSIGRLNNEIKPVLRYAVYAAADSGMPEAEIARRSGLDRMTVRSWLGKKFKRGDLVIGVVYGHPDPSIPETVTGRFVPRDDHPNAAPPIDAAWIDDGGPDGGWMVKRETIKHA